MFSVSEYIANTKYIYNIHLYIYMYIYIYVFFLSLFAATCNVPLGMETGAITDAQITASSAHDTAFVGPQHAR